MPSTRLIALSLLTLALNKTVYGADDSSKPSEDSLSDVVVTAKKIESLPLNSTDISQSATQSELLTGQATTSSTGDLLQEFPGVYVYNKGGVSSLPMIHGLGDDRLNVTVDGMNLFPACPNHMNSPLSYIDPSKVESITVYTGVSPVSVSNDSLGGAVVVNPAKPQFASSGGELANGELGGDYRSNGHAYGGNVKATLANDRFSMTYTGSETKSDDYTAGGNFKNYTNASSGDGGSNYPPPLAQNTVGSTFYKAFNQELSWAMKNDNHLFELKVGTQDIPYEGFVNQYMDMLSNKSTLVNLRYAGELDWADVDVQVYHQRVDHYMNFGDDRQFLYANGVNGNDMGMPMNTASDTTGVKAKLSKELSDSTLFRSGVDIEQYHLNDWWPAAPVDTGGVDQSGAMGPNTYQNINNGERDVYSAFGEIENKLTNQVSSIVGLRYELAKESTGAITSTYSPMYAIPPAYQSAQSRQDQNWDLSAILKYAPSRQENYEVGFSRNAKSPNLYELYAWNNPSNMMAAMTAPMNNFVGDGNGYVGNPNLKPEVANKLSLDADWHDADKEVWGVQLSPYYTYVQNYIAAQCAGYPGYTNCPIGQYNILQYINQNASIYGSDLSGKMRIGSLPAFGLFSLSGVISYVRGKNETTGDNLYNMMPLNFRMALSEKVGSWTNALESQFVHAKTQVSAIQNEIATPGYSLFNLRSTWAEKNYSVSFGVDNVLNKFYYLPLGGAYIGQGVTMYLNGANNGSMSAVPGMGISFYTRFTAKF